MLGFDCFGAPALTDLLLLLPQDRKQRLHSGCISPAFPGVRVKSGSEQVREPRSRLRLCWGNGLV